MTLQRKRIRIAADAAKRATDSVIDIFSGSTPGLWVGNDVQFEIGLFLDAELIADISNIASLTLEVRPSADRTQPPLMQKTVLAADLDGTVDSAAWLAKTKQHALVSFTGQETNLAIIGSTMACWLVIGVVTNDSPGRVITIQGGTITFYQDGIGSAGSPPTLDPLYYNQADSDARYVQKHEDQGWTRWYNGKWYHYIQSTGLWYPEVAQIVDNIPVLTLGPGETL